MEKALIVTSEETIEEAQALKKFASRRSASVDLMIVEKTGMKIGVFFDQHEEFCKLSCHYRCDELFLSYNQSCEKGN